MTSYTIVMMKGNLVRDPELKLTKSGHKVCHFTIAVDDGYTDSAKTTKRSYFFDCDSWDTRADYITQWIHGGDSITVRGRLTQRKFQKVGSPTPTVYTTIVVEDVLDSYHRRDQNQQAKAQGEYDNEEETTAPTTKVVAPAPQPAPAPVASTMPNRPQPSGAPANETPTQTPVSESDVIDVVDDDLPF